MYCELHTITNFSFLRGASRPEELVARAAELGYRAIAITDECSLAGVVKAHVAAKLHQIKLIVGSEFHLQEQIKLILLAANKTAYRELSALITLARRRSTKGEYQLSFHDMALSCKHCLAIWLPDTAQLITHQTHAEHIGQQLKSVFANRLWIGVERLLATDEQIRYLHCYALAKRLDLPMVACGDVHMHCSSRKPLQDALTAIRLNTSIDKLGKKLHANNQRHLRSLAELKRLYPQALLDETCRIGNLCQFSLDELRYYYPKEVVPDGMTPNLYLRHLVTKGAKKRWPNGTPAGIQAMIDKELALIRELSYEYYFLTVFDIVLFARSHNILCQGRGSAANSVVCYCLFITEVSPTRISLLFERFISKERNEPPDIDVDFEHERREEVIQYIYKKYSRERAALAATVITYRARSAVRDIGKALGLQPLFVDQLAKSLAWWDRLGDLKKRFQESNLPNHQALARHFFRLVQEILGFPRHLSQHVGGFVISEGPISQLAPVENASMKDRTVIQWDKEDIEALGLLKVDVLALGMLTAIRKCLALIGDYQPGVTTMQDIPEDDRHTYDMLCRGDSVGVFQVESRAQMSMLPRLRPRCYYDLVIEVAIVRPGPIQGNMVHPYLRRRENPQDVTYPNDDIKQVLQSTLGIPIFQEQAIKLAMVAAGFSAGEADQLRRAMASWGKNGNLMQFETRLISGMKKRGYREDFAMRLFEQIKGFGGYGFPESHSASFALLAYNSAWLKRHHPAAFYCALLNSQPMGFYSPSQLIQDAKRHSVDIKPVDITVSAWDHQLELPVGKVTADRQPAVRLGLRLVKGFNQAAAERIVCTRQHSAFRNVHDLGRRARLNPQELEVLASANALQQFSLHRYHAHWQVLAIEPERPLLVASELTGSGLISQKSLGQERNPEHQIASKNLFLPRPSPEQNMLADYQSTGLTLGQHPMALLRHNPAFKHCKRHADLSALNNGRFVRIAGLVTGRQRPGTASGVVFLTLEDETGNTNVIVWKDLQTRYRQALLNSTLLLIKGIMESKNEVIHVIAGEIIDYSDMLDNLAIKSRDFH